MGLIIFIYLLFINFLLEIGGGGGNKGPPGSAVPADELSVGLKGGVTCLR